MTMGAPSNQSKNSKVLDFLRECTVARKILPEGGLFVRSVNSISATNCNLSQILLIFDEKYAIVIQSIFSVFRIILS